MRRPAVRQRRNLAFTVIRCPRLAPSDEDAIGFAALHGPGGRLGGLAQRNGQEARRQGIERAAMTGLGRAEQPLHLGEGLGRAEALGLVEGDPAVDMFASAHFLLARSRATAGSLRSRSILSA